MLQEVSVLISLILIFSFIGTASAAEISVGTGKEYSTIQEAIDNGTQP